MATMDLKLKILPNGCIRFRRGSKEYNEKMLKILSNVVDNEEKDVEKLVSFFKGSEETEILIGKKIFCG